MESGLQAELPGRQQKCAFVECFAATSKIMGQLLLVGRDAVELRQQHQTAQGVIGLRAVQRYNHIHGSFCIHAIPF